jgi:thiamine pyrophosphate-dependent acetolactate synthase large subunit-like protein
MTASEDLVRAMELAADTARVGPPQPACIILPKRDFDVFKYEHRRRAARLRTAEMTRLRRQQKAQRKARRANR